MQTPKGNSVCVKHGPYDDMYKSCPYCASEQRQRLPVRTAYRLRREEGRNYASPPHASANNQARFQADFGFTAPSAQRMGNTPDALNTQPPPQAHELLGYLVVRLPLNMRGMVFMFRDGTTLGSHTSCTIVLNDPQIAPQQAYFYTPLYQGARIFAIYNVMKNGAILVNQVSIVQPVMLHQDYIVQVSKYQFEVKLLSS